MNCLGFEVSMPELLEPKPSPTLGQAAHRHLAACESCRELWQAVAGDVLSQDPQLTLQIVERTGGKSCGQVRRRLRARLEDDRVLRHLQDCPSCKYWLLEIAWQEPSRAASFFSSRFPKLGLFEKLLRRPRFGLEAAYAGTLLFFLLLGGGAIDALARLPIALESQWTSVAAGMEAVTRQGEEQWHQTRSAVFTLQSRISLEISALHHRLSQSESSGEPASKSMR